MPAVGVDQFLAAVLQNRVVRDVLERAEALGLPDWYLAAGCLYQTVWNVLDGLPPERGIADYDIIYFDDTDLSWEAPKNGLLRTAANQNSRSDGVVDRGRTEADVCGRAIHARWQHGL